MSNQNPRGALLVFFIIFLLLQPQSTTPNLYQQLEFNHKIDEEYHELAVLRNSSYGDLSSDGGKWLNLTGLREGDGFGWDILPKVKEKARGQLRYLLPEDPGDVFEEGSKPEDWTVYKNVTGYVLGRWARSKVEDGFRRPAINFTRVMPLGGWGLETFGRNITGRAGKVTVSLSSKQGTEVKIGNDTMAGVTAEVEISEDETAMEWSLRLHGIVYEELGSVLLTTTSDKFPGIFASPHFALSKDTYGLTQKFMNETLPPVIKEQEDGNRWNSNPWTSSPQSSPDPYFIAAQCELIMYLQQAPIALGSDRSQAPGAKTQDLLQAIEDELRFPVGAPVPKAPQLQMSMVAFSPDCGYVIESVGPPDFTPDEGYHLHGPKTEVLLGASRNAAILFLVVLCLQLLLLMRQMKEASAPSIRNRISFYTIAMLALADGFTFLSFLTAGTYMTHLSLTLIAAAFIGFLSVTAFGARFLLAIAAVQVPESQRIERQRAAAAAAAASEGTATNDRATATEAPIPPAPPPAPPPTLASADTLPLPVTARTAASSGATPIVLPPDQDAPADEGINTATNGAATIGSFHGRLYLILFGLMFLSLHATTWPPPLRSAYCNLIAFCYLSFWCPQIYRNIMRNCRKALTWEYVIGQSALRILPVAYFYAIPNNVLFVSNDVMVLLVLVAWLWIQILILASQELLGPRFFIRQGWAPPAYDYHPILREDEEGVTMPIGFSEATHRSPGPSSSARPKEARDKNKRAYDCAICMQDIEVPVVPAGGAGAESVAEVGSNILARRAYMVTPCRHIFHSGCLEGWMRYRLQCPICREILPPL